MVFEARIESEWALICSGEFDNCYRDALNNGFRHEGHVTKGLLLYNPSKDTWATITRERTDTVPGSFSNWYLFEYPSRPKMGYPITDMLKEF